MTNEHGRTTRGNAVAGCVCGWCVNARLRRNRLKHLRQLGRGAYTNPGEMQRLLDHIAHLRTAYGMTLERISVESGVALPSLMRYLHGERARARRHCYEAIMACTWAPGMPPGADTGRRAGAYVDNTGTVRRLTALYAHGFPYSWMARQLGLRVGKTGSSNIPKMLQGPTTVTYGMYRDVKDLFDKYQNTDPRESGVTEQTYGRTRTMAARKRLAPPICWDDDTIDDPQAIAQWTGLCGTWQGYNKHYRTGIPACQPCTDAIGPHKQENARKRYAEGYRRPAMG